MSQKERYRLPGYTIYGKAEFEKAIKQEDPNKQQPEYKSDEIIILETIAQRHGY